MRERLGKFLRAIGRRVNTWLRGIRARFNMWLGQAVWLREERRTTALGVAVVLISMATLLSVFAAPYGHGSWNWLMVGIVLALAVGAIAVLFIGLRGPRLFVGEPETRPRNIAPGPVPSDLEQVIWRLRVRNRRAGTIAQKTQVELVVSKMDGSHVWTGMAHWRHQNEPALYPGVGELDLGGSVKNRRLIDVIYHQRDGSVWVRDSDEQEPYRIPDEPVLIVATAFANNARDFESRWIFSKEKGLCEP